MRLFVCLFVPLFLCASEQQYREFVFLLLLLPAVSTWIVGFFFLSFLALGQKMGFRGS